MNKNNKSKFIRIIGEKGFIDKSEIESVAVNVLLSENSFLICGLNGNACENFLYGEKFAEISTENTETNLNDHGTCLFEELVNNLFIQTKAIKQYYEQNRSNEIYFNKIKCSFVLINGKTSDCDSECLYDVFQGLNSPVEVISDNGVESLNVLEVDANDPVQIFNMVNIARKLQFENSAIGKKSFHTLFIFNIESAIYDKNIENFCMLDKMYKRNKIYILDYHYNLAESSTFNSSKITKLEDFKDSTISFFKNLTLMMAKTSNFLFGIVSKAIFDSKYSSVIHFQYNGLNLFIDKCNIEQIPICNFNFNLWNKFNDNSIYANESTLASFIKKFHDYYLFFKNNYLSLNRGDYETINFQDNDLTQALEDLKLVLFNLCGKVIKHEDLLFNIEHIGDITKIIDNNDSYDCKTPIRFNIINQCLNGWNEESEGNEEIALSFKEVFQDDYLDENDTLSAEFTPRYRYRSQQFGSIEDNTPGIFNSNLEFESELINHRNKNQTYNLNKSVIGINDELLRIKNGKPNVYNRLNSFGEKHTRSYLSIPNYFKFKHSETPISKILLAVNTARRRVREYRLKQQTNKDSTAEFNQDTIKIPQPNLMKDKFWNKTLSKRPIFSYSKNISEVEVNYCNTYSVQNKIEIHAEPPNSKDAEVQVNNINSEKQSKYLHTTRDKLHGINVSKTNTIHNFSIEILENHLEEKQTVGLNSLNEVIGIKSNLLNNPISYAPINSLSFNYQKPIIYQNTSCSPMFPMHNIGIATFSGRNVNGCFYHRVKQH